MDEERIKIEAALESLPIIFLEQDAEVEIGDTLSVKRESFCDYYFHVDNQQKLDVVQALNDFTIENRQGKQVITVKGESDE